MIARTVSVLFMVYGTYCLDYIFVRNSYFRATRGSFRLFYNISDTSKSSYELQCSSRNLINIGDPNVTTNIPLHVDLTVDHRNDYQESGVQCSIGNVSSNLFYIVYQNEAILYLCNEIYRKDETLKLTFQLNKEFEAAKTYSCHCDNKLSFNLMIGKGTTSIDVTATINNCDTKICTCLFTCDTVLSVYVFILSDDDLKLYSTFTQLSTYQSAYILPQTNLQNSDSKCTVVSCKINNYEFGECGDAIEIIALNRTAGVIHQVLPNKTAAMSPSVAYGVTCEFQSLSAEQFFQFFGSSDSTLFGPAVRLNGRGDVTCSCNVTDFFCDAGCCCDTDCSSDQVCGS